ncbi:MAG: hypothetical protein Q7R53_01255, partial [bacterium]|nr:hypothetical protein [bacterium]
EFKSFKNKKEAMEYVKELPPRLTGTPPYQGGEVGSGKKIIPIFLKADVSGSLEAIEKEIAKIKNKGAGGINSDNTEFRIIGKGIGPISESDIKTISGNSDVLVIGFNVKADKSAIEMAQTRNIPIKFFNIIYKMTEWLEEKMEELRPRIETTETTGKAKIIRAFSRTKERQIVGGKVVEGKMVLGSIVKIMRRDFEIGRGKIVNLEKTKVKTSVVEEGTEFGMMIESKIEIASGDVLESFSIAQK